MSEPEKGGGLPNPAPVKAETTVPPVGKPTGWRKWLYRLAAMTLVPALVFGILEGSLRIAGSGYPTDFFLNGAKTEGPGVWVDNPDFGRWVFPRMLDRTPLPVPFALPKVKRVGTYRIFVLGESAAMGFPDPSTSFARVLEVMLRDRYPDTRFEVINASMVAINSHVVLPIARQCGRSEPDLFVVHLGNNEVVGPFGAAGVLGPFSPHLRVIRANLAVKTTRTGQLLNGLVHRLGRDNQTPRAWQGMAMFVNCQVPAEDSRLTRIYAHFRENLQDICSVGAEAGIPVIVCTVPVNLKDCAPFGSLHAPELGPERTETWEKEYNNGVRLETEGKFTEAIRCYEEAAQTDDRFADLAFRLGRCHAALGENTEARRHYVRARDLDTLRFRSDTTINETIRDVAAARAAQGVRLADAERAFRESSPSGIAGEGFFLEHVHMNIKGNYLLARTVFEIITDQAPPALGSSAKEKVAPLSERECAERLAHTEWNELKVATQIHEMLTRQPPFIGQLDHLERGRRWQAKREALRGRLQAEGLKKALAEYQKAIQTTERDWMIRLNFGQLLTECGAVEPAEEQYRAALKALHHCFPAHCKLGTLLLGTGRVAEASFHFREALRLAPDCSEAHYGMAAALAAEGKNAEALAIYKEQVRKEPDRSYPLVALGDFLYRTGELEGAKARFAEALRLEPDNATAHAHLGDAALKQGKAEEAIEHYAAALRLRPEWPELRQHLAKVRKDSVP